MYFLNRNQCFYGTVAEWLTRLTRIFTDINFLRERMFESCQCRFFFCLPMLEELMTIFFLHHAHVQSALTVRDVSRT
jgi:hypothetical protein